MMADEKSAYSFRLRETTMQSWELPFSVRKLEFLVSPWFILFEAQENFNALGPVSEFLSSHSMQVKP